MHPAENSYYIGAKVGVFIGNDPPKIVSYLGLSYLCTTNLFVLFVCFSGTPCAPRRKRVLYRYKPIVCILRRKRLPIVCILRRKRVLYRSKPIMCIPRRKARAATRVPRRKARATTRLEDQT